MDSRSSARARKKRVRTVASGMDSACATSSTVISSTARSTEERLVVAAHEAAQCAFIAVGDSVRELAVGELGECWCGGRVHGGLTTLDETGILHVPVPLQPRNPVVIG